MISKLVFENISFCLANRRVPCRVDLPSCASYAVNSVRVPRLGRNFQYNCSLQLSTAASRLLHDLAVPSASPICVTSLVAQRASKSCEKMDSVARGAGVDISYVTIDKNEWASEQSQEPYAELCAAGRGCVTAEQLGSVTALSDWLKDRLSLGSGQALTWGSRPGTKTVWNLWLELLEGEISLEDSRPPIRTVHVACVKITNGSGKVLLESHQEMVDGSKRERNRPLSEKMKPGETVEAACLRGINEELGSELGAAKRVSMLQNTYNREVQRRESFSYPGLMTCYVLHHMEAVMKHLPADDFVTEENEHCHSTEVGKSSSGPPENEDKNSTNGRVGTDEVAIGVKRHFWKWVPEHLNS